MLIEVVGIVNGDMGTGLPFYVLCAVLTCGESDVALLFVIRSCRLWAIDNSGLSVVVCRNRGLVCE